MNDKSPQYGPLYLHSLDLRLQNLDPENISKVAYLIESLMKVYKDENGNSKRVNKKDQGRS